MQVQPYVFFEGKAQEAADFYVKALGAKVEMIMRYSDSPMPVTPDMAGPAAANAVMHMALRIGQTVFMGSDGMNSGKPEFKGITLSIDVPTDADAKRVFDALADGGKVRQALSKTFFSSSFGMVDDRFGVSWMVIVPDARHQQAQQQQ